MIWNKTTDKLPELTSKRFDACGYTVEQSDLLLLRIERHGKELTLTGHYCGQDGWLINGFDGDAWIVREGVTEWAAIQDETHVVSADKRVCPVCGAGLPTDDCFDFIRRDEVNYCYSCGARLEVKEG